MANKVSFGLSNVHYALISERTVGGKLQIFYGKPKQLKGAVNLEMETVGDVSNFYADNIIYYASTANQGYEATLEIAMLTDEFRRDVLGEVIDANGLILENSNTNPRKIALMFQFEGDEREVKHCLTYCTVTRPSMSGATKTEATEPTTQELTITVSPRPTDNVPRISTSELAKGDVFEKFFESVPEVTVKKGTAPKGTVGTGTNNNTGFTVSYAGIHEALYFNGVALENGDITDKLYHKGGGTGFEAVYATKAQVTAGPSNNPPASPASSTITITFTDGAKASTGNYVIIDGLTDKDGNPINEVYEYENAKWNKRD